MRFSISRLLETPYTKSYVDTDTKRVVSTFFEKKMQTDCSYTISYTGLKSLSGKAMQDECLEVILQEEGSDPSPEPDPVPGRPDSYPKGSVVINEVMGENLGTGEWWSMLSYAT